MTQAPSLKPWTAGPWTWETHELSEELSSIVYDQHGQMVADHLSPERAALICASPALYEALDPEILEIAADTCRKAGLAAVASCLDIEAKKQRAALLLARGGGE
jgi:hypothetical protein